MGQFTKVFFAFIVSSNLHAASFKLPKEYKAVLDCPAAHGAPSFMLALKDRTLYLMDQKAGQVRAHDLYINDGDMGYLALELEQPADLEKYMSSFYILNDEEDIEDPEQAQITGGKIRLDERDEVQMCEVVNIIKMSDFDPR